MSCIKKITVIPENNENHTNTEIVETRVTDLGKKIDVIKIIHYLFLVCPKNKKAIHLIKKIYPIEFQTIKYKEQLGAKLRKKFLKYYQISLEINLNSTKEKN